MEALGGVGSDTAHFECPHCGCTDRERHLLLYLRAAGSLQQMQGRSILHFAPEKRLSKHIAAIKPNRYIRCDLYPNAPDIQRVDMLAIPFADASVDFVIANHVLEHVADDRKALTEIHRVLKPGGYAILQTPYADKLHTTWQDPGIDTDAARLQAYGQKDHVRLFGRDIFTRFADAGLEPQVASHNDILSGTDADRYGVNSKEPFFLFRKHA
jgi:SAM-dependent methyltransferase